MKTGFYRWRAEECIATIFIRLVIGWLIMVSVYFAVMDLDVCRIN